jgi:hypothetical protein
MRITDENEATVDAALKTLAKAARRPKPQGEPD